MALYCRLWRRLLGYLNREKSGEKRRRLIRNTKCATSRSFPKSVSHPSFLKFRFLFCFFKQLQVLTEALPAFRGDEIYRDPRVLDTGWGGEASIWRWSASRASSPSSRRGSRRTDPYSPRENLTGRGRSGSTPQLRVRVRALRRDSKARSRLPSTYPDG